MTPEVKEILEYLRERLWGTWSTEKSVDVVDEIIKEIESRFKKKTGTEEPFMNAMKTAIDSRLKFISENQEKFVEAFIAETGLKPSECVMKVRRDALRGQDIWFEARNTNEPEESNSQPSPQTDMEPSVDTQLKALSERLGKVEDHISILSTETVRHRRLCEDGLRDIFRRLDGLSK